MPYQVSRNGQMYGPYTLEDLQRYVQSGNVLSTDLAKSEGMSEWLPVSQILGTPGAQPINPAATGTPGFGGQTVGGQTVGGQTFGAQPVGVQPGAYVPGMSGVPAAGAFAGAGAYPDPPNLNWGLVLLFGILTCGLFSIIWEIVIASFSKKLEPASKAVILYAAVFVLFLLSTGMSFANAGATLRNGGLGAASGLGPIGSLFSLAYLVLLIVGRFTVRNTLEKHYNGPEPLGLRLSGVMTFFFGGIYFQYHLNRINEMKQALRFRNAAI